MSSSVATAPGLRPASPEAMTSGRSLPSSAAPNVSMALPIRVGRGLEVAREGDVVLEGEVDDPVGRGGGGPQTLEVVEAARWTWAPAAAIASAEASERASPTTSWPASMSSGTTAEPIQPLAPVTNTRMSRSSSR